MVGKWLWLYPASPPHLLFTGLVAMFLRGPSQWVPWESSESLLVSSGTALGMRITYSAKKYGGCEVASAPFTEQMSCSV